MAQFKTKQVDSCICGKNSEKLTRTDKNQALAVMAIIIGIATPILVIASAFQGALQEDVGDSGGIFLIAIYVIFFGLLGHRVLKNRQKDHSLKCSIRQAFFSIT